MNKTKTSLSFKTIALFVAAAIALTFAFAGTARAALTYFSDDYQSDIELTELDVSLAEQYINEQGNTVKNFIPADGELLTWMKDITVAPGKPYTEELSAENTGTQAEYVRVVITKYWLDEDGKAVDLDPSLIKLELSNNGWVEDTDMSTREQTILYSVNPLEVGDSLAFSKSISLDPSILDEVTTETDGNVTTITYKYNGYSFGITAEVDSVQTHSAARAMRDVWGINAQDLGINA